MRKFLSVMAFGYLSKDIAGTRPLTNKERRSLLTLIYSSVGFYLWYFFKDMRHENDHMEGNTKHEADFDPAYRTTEDTLRRANRNLHQQVEDLTRQLHESRGMGHLSPSPPEQCHHGLSASLCADPVHHYPQDQDMPF